MINTNMNEIQRLQQLAGIVNEDEDIGHTDNEKRMLSDDLYIIGKSAVELHRMLKDLPDDSDFPHWWQSKLVKAKEYISGAKDYLDATLNNPDEEIEVSDELKDNEDPSGVS